LSIAQWPGNLTRTWPSLPGCAPSPAIEIGGDMIEYDKHEWSKHLFSRSEASMVLEISVRVLPLRPSGRSRWSAFDLYVKDVHIAPTVHNAGRRGLLGFSLVFRTNSSYEPLLGRGGGSGEGIINETRNLGPRLRGLTWRVTGP